MDYNDIKNYIYREYNLHKNSKIVDIDMFKQQFSLRFLGRDMILPFGTILKRELKLRELGI
jgi:hypothetical protein